jgi:hypothetical protein
MCHHQHPTITRPRDLDRRRILLETKPVAPQLFSLRNLKQKHKKTQIVYPKMVGFSARNGTLRNLLVPLLVSSLSQSPLARAVCFPRSQTLARVDAPNAPQQRTRRLGGSAHEAIAGDVSGTNSPRNTRPATARVDCGSASAGAESAQT